MTGKRAGRGRSRGLLLHGRRRFIPKPRCSQSSPGGWSVREGPPCLPAFPAGTQTAAGSASDLDDDGLREPPTDRDTTGTARRSDFLAPAAARTPRSFLSGVSRPTAATRFSRWLLAASYSRQHRPPRGGRATDRTGRSDSEVSFVRSESAAAAARVLRVDCRSALRNRPSLCNNETNFLGPAARTRGTLHGVRDRRGDKAFARKPGWIGQPHANRDSD